MNCRTTRVSSVRLGLALVARLANLLSDGDGFRAALQWRGGASMKPCFKHDNVLKRERPAQAGGLPIPPPIPKRSKDL